MAVCPHRDLAFAYKGALPLQPIDMHIAEHSEYYRYIRDTMSKKIWSGRNTGSTARAETKSVVSDISGMASTTNSSSNE